MENEVPLYFDDYNVECLGDTVRKGIPEFLKWYDAKYFPQNTILTLDYPLLFDIHSLSGADAVYTYIRAIKVEQLFLKKFERNYVIEVLRRAVPGYRQMIENVLNGILHKLIEQIYDGNQEMLTYLGNAVKNIAVRIVSLIRMSRR